jgi:hypothetical protein
MNPVNASKNSTGIGVGIGVVYECPECETRTLNERRCPDCNLFTRRIGSGGTCPHCEEPVAISDLCPNEVTPMN